MAIITLNYEKRIYSSHMIKNCLVPNKLTKTIEVSQSEWSLQFWKALGIFCLCPQSPWMVWEWGQWFSLLVNSSHPYMRCLVCSQVMRSCTGIWVTNRSPPSQKSRPVTRCPTAPQENGNSSEVWTTSAAASVLSMQTYTTAPPYPTRKPWLGSLQPNPPREPPQNPHCSAAGSPDSSCSHTEPRSLCSIITSDPERSTGPVEIQLGQY